MARRDPPFGSRKAIDYATGDKPEARFNLGGILRNKWTWIVIGSIVIFGLWKGKKK